MKIRNSIFLIISLILLAGCASDEEVSDSPVRVGMSRDGLRHRYGEPLRIAPDGSGGENWYYRFASWNSQPTQDSGTIHDNGQTTVYGSVGVQLSPGAEERPIHLSADGYVTDPLPAGKVVKN